MADVIDASSEVPVIVDFWAPWCGPCKTLGPALEKAVTEAKGKVRLVKIDVDQNQRIAAQMRVQSIPAVFAFVNGQPVDGFMGAQAPAQIKAFVDRLVADVGRQRRARGGAARWPRRCSAEGAVADAAQTFAAILPRTRATSRRSPGSRGRTWRSGEFERAREILALAPKGKENDSGDPGGAGADRARRGERRGRRDGGARGGAGAQPGRPPGALRPGDGAGRRGRPRPRRSTRCSSFSAATASGTTARRRRSSSSCSTASGRRARRRRRGGGGSAR